MFLSISNLFYSPSQVAHLLSQTLIYMHTSFFLYDFPPSLSPASPLYGVFDLVLRFCRMNSVLRKVNSTRHGKQRSYVEP